MNTEKSSLYHFLEKMSVEEILFHINNEDKKVAIAIEKSLDSIAKLVKAILPRMKQGGRVFYIGAGTSGRLGILDSSECPPTYGVSSDVFIGIIAGGDSAIRTSVEHAEDDATQAWEDMNPFHPDEKDTVIGIAASGKTPYVVGAIQKAKKNGLLTGCITCNEDTLLSKECDFPIVAVVGPEFVTGSTRMKSGTAQKLILNMISTSLMIQLGHVKGNKMIDMKPTNDKLRNRAVKIIMEELQIEEIESGELLNIHKSVRKSIQNYRKEI